MNSEITPQNDFIKAEYIRDFSQKEKDAIAEALEKDSDGLINIFRMTAQRSEKAIDLGNYSNEN